jgi:hypothetical protein
MLPLLFTIDTEYSSGFFADGSGRAWEKNFARCIACEAKGGEEVGIFYQMDVFERHGLRGVFFVDPMPALVWGTEAISRIVNPILERGHDVQLHVHTEWLRFAERNPVGARTGNNLADFSLDEQSILLDYAIEQLMAAGAPAPVAFRAGNYGANDDTLRALSKKGILFDTSFPPGILRSACRISLAPDDIFPVSCQGTVELPVGAIGGRGGNRRHAQLTAMSAWELISALTHAKLFNWPAFVLVSHSFELMNRKSGVANGIVQRRFESLCKWLAGQSEICTADFRQSDFVKEILIPENGRQPNLLPHNAVRELLRIGEQAVANLVYR